MLDLREQNGLERRRFLHALLTRPLALQHLIVAIREEGFSCAVEHGLEKMRGAKPIMQKHAAARVET
ncbi:hypothetical protein [Bradyrhizobium elkanii]|uniref:hypothetical protein n=1 Tax=Bradyrhizobium elkanii TaxID=29448 RepID=UPI002169FBF6|nr:hypothetical protein [Bradyrhizobium elkanii]MCS3524530.1 hypothetical protein [Bradyrhizobium elkanii]MCS4078819.1 hypothetical protein [Bradyrhizobium elkanii]